MPIGLHTTPYEQSDDLRLNAPASTASPFTAVSLLPELPAAPSHCSHPFPTISFICAVHSPVILVSTFHFWEIHVDFTHCPSIVSMSSTLV